MNAWLKGGLIGGIITIICYSIFIIGFRRFVFDLEIIEMAVFLGVVAFFDFYLLYLLKEKNKIWLKSGLKGIGVGIALILIMWIIQLSGAADLFPFGAWAVSLPISLVVFINNLPEIFYLLSVPIGILANSFIIGAIIGFVKSKNKGKKR